MHPALNIAEIVQLICDSVAELDYRDQLRCKTFLALAKTATIFTHSALNGLWERQTTLIHVLRCLPAAVWDDERGILDDGSSFHLLRPVNRFDLERLLIHSMRVRVLDLTEKTENGDSRDFWSSGTNTAFSDAWSSVPFSPKQCVYGHNGKPNTVAPPTSSAVSPQWCYENVDGRPRYQRVFLATHSIAHTFLIYTRDIGDGPMDGH
ncbi:hypothetical protein C8J57DRAFT_1590767 [Mycena rebaudengoi]|nr:hypothetical protein C8J57DRAFT_1590767 [Mycena rebaudengoi]